MKIKCAPCLVFLRWKMKMRVMVLKLRRLKKLESSFFFFLPKTKNEGEYVKERMREL